MPQAADILSDPEINQAYEDVRSDKSETTWLVLKVRRSTLPDYHPYLSHIPPANSSLWLWGGGNCDLEFVLM